MEEAVPRAGNGPGSSGQAAAGRKRKAEEAGGRADLGKAMLQDVLARSPKRECAMAIEESLKREGWVPQPSIGTGGPSWIGHMPRLMLAVFLLGVGPLGEALLVPRG